MIHRLLHIEDLTPQRQDGLDVPVAALLGRTACGVSLHKKDLALLRILLRTVGELPGHSGSGHDGLALHHLPGLSGGLSCGSGEDDLVDDVLGLLRMLLEVDLERICSSLGHGGVDLLVSELRLCLSLELRLGHLDRDHRRKSFPVVFRSELVRLDLVEEPVLLGIRLQRPREPRLEALKMGSSFYSVDVVDIRLYLLPVARVVLESYLYRNHLVSLETDRLRNELLHSGIPVQILHELLKAVFRIVDFGTVRLRLMTLPVSIGDLLPLVREGQGYALVQEGKLAKTA